MTYTYCADGSVESVTDSSNVSPLSRNTATTTYVYDLLSRVETISQSGSGASSKAVLFEYYSDSQVGTIFSFSGSSEMAIGAYTYDGDERLTGLTYTHPNGSAITTAGGHAISYTVGYDAASNITQVVSADGTDNYTVDSSDQPHGQPHQREL